MQTLGFAHYNLRAPRELLDSLCNFYAEVVGLSVGNRPPFKSFGYWLYADGQDILHLSEAGADEVRTVGLATTFDHVAFKCIGRSAFQQKLDQTGITYRVARVPQTGQQQLFFQDPAGNGVELNFADGDE
jgi:catechol-2,3-dioxygenase